MRLSKLCSTVCGICCLLCTVAFSAAASAATESPSAIEVGAGADTTVVQQFDIPSKPLPEALADFARQAGTLVAVDRSLLAGLRSAPVSGRFTSSEALRRLLSGTGLEASFPDGSSVVLNAAGERSSAYTLRPVVVTGRGRTAGYASGRSSSATRTDTPLRDAPQSVSVVTNELISEQAMQSMADVVRYAPGITMGQGEGHRDQPSIRGINTTADFFVEGVRDDGQYYRDLYNVDRVEVLKGPNAMTFGRGGGGGIINRLLKQAEWAPAGSFVLEGGAYAHRRSTLDFGRGFGNRAAARVTGMAESSGGFRQHARISRRGVNPTVALALPSGTMVRIGYEDFHDERFVDRGIPSYQGRPSAARIETFFGNPGVAEAYADVRSGSLVIERAALGAVGVRSRTHLVGYDKFYANTLPGAVNAAGTEVAITAYNSLMQRHNAFNQTDVTYSAATGPVHHTLLFGAEFGRQRTNAVRQTGFFDDVATSVTVPFDRPVVTNPVTFRPSATDADGRTVVRTTAFYAQDQIALTRHVHAVAGLRHDRFSIRFHNNRNGEDRSRDDNLLSPRAGLIVKPVEPVSLYASYSLSHLPGAGEQFTGLSATTEAFDPEKFVNREFGVKWDVRPELSLTGAAYRLDHTNAAAPHPTDATRLVQTGHQRVRGVELGFNGRVTDVWSVAGGYAAQKGRVVSRISAAAEGATLPLLPARTFSLWNRFSLPRGYGAGLGVIHQADMYAAIDNSVTLPAFTRVDAAVYVPVIAGVRVQANVENLFDRRYYPTSHGNNNIMPGAPRTALVSIRAAF